MKKVIFCLTTCCCLLMLQALQARSGDRSFRFLPQWTGSSQQDTARQVPDTIVARTVDSVGRTVDSAGQLKDTVTRSADTLTKPALSVNTTQDVISSNPDSVIKALDSAMKVMDTSGKVPVVIGTDTAAKTGDSTGRSQDTTSRSQGPATKSQDPATPATDSTVKNTDPPVKIQDPASQSVDSAAKVTEPADPSATGKKDAAATDASSLPDKSGASRDSADASAKSAKRELDTRWFISPLMKFQFQDFGFLEKNRKGYLSDANNLSFFDRGNASFAASAYKNITSRLSISADIGLSFGHVTNDNVLISQTKSKTYNLLNAALYYHLLGPSYRLQPYVTVGINDLINDASYASAPIGFGAKFNSRKIMALAQISYGYAISKSVSNTTMYSVGIYIPLKNKKSKKQQDADDTSPYNRPGKDDEKKNKDDQKKNRDTIINNITININMDSVLKAKGLLNDDDKDGSGNGGHRRRKGKGGSGNGDDDYEDQEALKPFNLEDFNSNDFRVTHENGHPVIRFVVYFEFNEYSLNSKAFSSIDKVISHIRNVPNLYIEIKGYTDDVGTDQYNNFLSRRRANMVKDYINSRGISADLMKAKAYGKDNPVADNGNPNTAWLNRRAEIIVRLK